jgi:hypothetical protein
MLGVGAGSLRDGAAALCADVAPLADATGGVIGELGAAAEGVDAFGADVVAGLVDAARGGASVLGAGTGAGSLGDAADAFGAVDPLANEVGALGPAMAQPGVGAGSASDG